jgi:hypothetical protein
LTYSSNKGIVGAISSGSNKGFLTTSTKGLLLGNLGNSSKQLIGVSRKRSLTDDKKLKLFSSKYNNHINNTISGSSSGGPPTTSAQLTIGDVIFGLYKFSNGKKRWFKGKLDHIYTDNPETYRIVYDDGDIEDNKPLQDIRKYRIMICPIDGQDQIFTTYGRRIKSIHDDYLNSLPTVQTFKSTKNQISQHVLNINTNITNSNSNTNSNMNIHNNNNNAYNSTYTSTTNTYSHSALNSSTSSAASALSVTHQQAGVSLAPTPTSAVSNTPAVIKYGLGDDIDG